MKYLPISRHMPMWQCYIRISPQNIVGKCCCYGTIRGNDSKGTFELNMLLNEEVKILMDVNKGFEGIKIRMAFG